MIPLAYWFKGIFPELTLTSYAAFTSQDRKQVYRFRYHHPVRLFRRPACVSVSLGRSTAMPRAAITNIHQYMLHGIFSPSSSFASSRKQTALMWSRTSLLLTCNRRSRPLTQMANESKKSAQLLSVHSEWAGECLASTRELWGSEARATKSNFSSATARINAELASLILLQSLHATNSDLITPPSP